MALVTDTTQIKLISKLARTSSFSSDDVLLLQRGFKSYKFQYDDFVDSLPDDDTLEASSNKLQIKNGGISTEKLANDCVTYSKMLDINASVNGRVIGRMSGGIGSPTVVDVYDDETFAANSSTALATQRSIKEYTDTQISNNVLFTEYEESDELAVPSAGSSVSDTLNNLTGTPKFVQASLRCVIDSEGYTVDEEVILGYNITNGFEGLAISFDGNTVTVNRNGVLSIVNKGGSTLTTITDSNWRIVIRAFS